MANHTQPYQLIGWTLFFASVAIFLVYHISHGMPGLDVMVR
jgi:hypothetical protein